VAHRHREPPGGKPGAAPQAKGACARQRARAMPMRGGRSWQDREPPNQDPSGRVTHTEDSNNTSRGAGKPV